MPIAESRSSYNGMLVFLFMVISATLAATVIHRLASAKLRRVKPGPQRLRDERPQPIQDQALFVSRRDAPKEHAGDIDATEDHATDRQNKERLITEDLSSNDGSDERGGGGYESEFRHVG